MAGAVHEPLTEPGRGDRLAGGRVDLLGRPPGQHRPHRPLLGVLQHRVGLANRRGRLGADGVRAGGVGVVAARQRPADVDHHDVARARPPGARPRGAGWRRSVPNRRSRTRRPTWPSSTIAAAMSAPTSDSVRPAFRNSAIRACTRSIAAPAARSSATSAASLRIRSSRMTGPASVCATSGNASRSPRTCAAGIESATAIRDGPPPRSLTSRYGSSPSTHVTISMPSASSVQVGEPGRFEPRHHQRRRGEVTRRRQHQAGQPLVRRALGSDEVAQVGARRDQQHVGTLRGGDVACAAQPLGEQVGGDGSPLVGRRSHARKRITGTAWQALGP